MSKVVIELKKDWWREERKASPEPIRIKRRTRLSEKYFRTSDVAKRLEVAKQTVRELIHSGKLEAVAIGRTYRISQEALEDYLLLANTGKKIG